MHYYQGKPYKGNLYANKIKHLQELARFYYAYRVRAHDFVCSSTKGTIMRQYTFKAYKDNATYEVRCTAAYEQWAYAQVCRAYSGLRVSQVGMTSAPAHHVLGEIDASNMTEDDYRWLLETA